MEQPYPYRDQLLAATQAFLMGTPDAIARGKALSTACPNLPSYSIADTVWGGIKSVLSDTMFQEDPTYLRTLQGFLEGRAPLPHFGAEKYNFLPRMTSAERACFEALKALALLLHDFPGEAEDPEQSRYTARFEQARGMVQVALTRCLSCSQQSTRQPIALRCARSARCCLRCICNGPFWRSV